VGSELDYEINNMFFSFSFCVCLTNLQAQVVIAMFDTIQHKQDYRLLYKKKKKKSKKVTKRHVTVEGDIYGSTSY
jgi:hypothetical protein